MLELYNDRLIDLLAPSGKEVSFFSAWPGRRTLTNGRDVKYVFPLCPAYRVMCMGQLQTVTLYDLTADTVGLRAVSFLNTSQPAKLEIKKDKKVSYITIVLCCLRVICQNKDDRSLQLNTLLSAPFTRSVTHSASFTTFSGHSYIF